MKTSNYAQVCKKGEPNSSSYWPKRKSNWKLYNEFNFNGLYFSRGYDSRCTVSSKKFPLNLVASGAEQGGHLKHWLALSLVLFPDSKNSNKAQTCPFVSILVTGRKIHSMFSWTTTFCMMVVSRSQIWPLNLAAIVLLRFLDQGMILET